MTELMKFYSKLYKSIISSFQKVKEFDKVNIPKLTKEQIEIYEIIEAIDNLKASKEAGLDLHLNFIKCLKLH